MGTAYVIDDDGASVPMTRLHCKNEDRELQRILELNHDLLPGEQIRPEDPCRWVLIKREMPVPDPGTSQDRWSIDFLFADQFAIPTFVECKRFNDTRSRREVVAQMIEYAANGPHYWDAQELREYAEATATARGAALEDLLASIRPEAGSDPDAYFTRLEHNLREGLLRVVFFLEESPVELRSMVEFLNRQMTTTDVLLVEARQYRHGDSRVVVPVLFGFTDEARITKAAAVASSGSGRRKWDRESFLEDARDKLQSVECAAVERLLEASASLGCEISWGTGAQNGSFNVKEPSISGKSLLSSYSEGSLYFNLNWLDDTDVAVIARDRLRALLKERLQIDLPESSQKQQKAKDWAAHVDVIAEILRTVVVECREAASA